MSDRFIVNNEITLLPFLESHLKGWTHSKIKQRLKTGCVFIDGETVTQYNLLLTPGNQVEVRASSKGTKHASYAKKPLEILYSDRNLVVINKPAGLLSVATVGENKEHALAILRNQLSRPKRPVKLWPVHRLDRDTSGVLLFATSSQIHETLQQNWSTAEKTYLAIVENSPNPSQGTIDQPLWMEAEKYHMNVGPHPQAKNAITHFSTLKTSKNRALLEVKIETGRQHQIRAHLAWLGHPVIGDPRYGKAGPRLGLHALRLSITRPKTGQRLSVETPAPKDFLELLN